MQKSGDRMFQIGRRSPDYLWDKKSQCDLEQQKEKVVVIDQQGNKMKFVHKLL